MVNCLLNLIKVRKRGFISSLYIFAFVNRLPLEYKWTVPGRWGAVRYRLEDSNRILIIEDIRLDDSGTYTCTVTGKAGRNDVTTYTLNVECKISVKQ